MVSPTQSFKKSGSRASPRSIRDRLSEGFGLEATQDGAVALEEHARRRESLPAGEDRKDKAHRATDDRVGRIGTAGPDLHRALADLDGEWLLAGAHLEALRCALR